jgi:hypothetical protein
MEEESMTVRTAVHTPVPKAALPDFTPVARRTQRHDGWTPERQKAFVEALADTGCVSIACRMVNMSQRSYYQLRRQPGATSFRAAADAAQSLGLQCVKDEAFDRAMTGELIPVFVGGKLMGYRRKKNDRLLMFILRHYGQDAGGRKTTINYFSTRATAGAAAQTRPSPLVGEGDSQGERGGGSGSAAAGALAAAEASTTTVKTVISGQAAPSQLAADDTAANLVNAFEGVELDPEAQAEIQQSLAACAERRRALRTDWTTPRPERLERQAADPECGFIRLAPGSLDYLGTLESGVEGDDFEPYDEQEPNWESIGEAPPAWFVEWEEREAARQAAKALPPPSDPPLDFEGRGTADAAVEGPSSEPSPSPEDLVADPPSSEKPKRPYKKRTPKPPFSPWTGQASPELVEEATAEVNADRNEAAAAEARRRERRRTMRG